MEIVPTKVVKSGTQSSIVLVYQMEGELDTRRPLDICDMRLK